MNTEILKNTIVLENLRLIYDGIVDLQRQILAISPWNNKMENQPKSVKPQRYIHRGRAELFETDTRESEIKECSESLLQGAFSETGELLRQNAIYSFCAFWKKLYDREPAMQDIRTPSNMERITRMVLLFDLLQRMADTFGGETEAQYEHDDLPYCFENICEYIRKIADCKNAYIIHRQGSGDIQIVCRSMFEKKEVAEQNAWSAADFFPLFPPTARDAERIADSVYHVPDTRPQTSGGKCAANHIIIRLTSVGEKMDEELYMVLQDMNELGREEQRLTRAAYRISQILFARRHLIEVTEQYYEHLLNSRYNCGFVHFYEGCDVKKYPVVLHLTDLHADDIMQSCHNEVINMLRKSIESFEKSVDLLVISGDIVEAKSGDVSQIQKNYRYAEKLLRELVVMLWERNGRVPFDWRRRVIIVPGNHDFAATNLLRIVLQRRSIAAGLPTDGNHEIVAKFAYYLDFLMRFIDAPIDALIRDSINEVREYRQMNTVVFMLNSSFGSTASRTNKVSLDRDAVSRLSQSPTWKVRRHRAEPYRICVVHQPPNRGIDYVLDAYDPLEQWEWKYIPKPKSDEENINNLYCLMCDTVDELKNANGKPSPWSDPFWVHFKLVFDAMEQKSIINLLNIAGREAKKHFFTEDATLLSKYLNKDGNDMSEEENRLIDRIHNDRWWSKKDTQEYQNTIQEYAGDAAVFLCGHVHEELFEKDFSSNDEINRRVVIGGRFLKHEKEKQENITQYKADSIHCLLLKANEGKDGGIEISISN